MRFSTLFDFNGVLIDDEHLHHACMREVLEPLGIGLTERDYFDRYFVFDDAGAFRAILEDQGREPSDLEVTALVDAKKPVYLRRADEARFFPGGAALVRACAKEGPVGIVSGALRHEITRALEAMGVRDAVSAIVSAEDTTRCKPDPEGYFLGRAALIQLGANPSAMVAIEDSPGGVQAAKAAGLMAIAVTHSASEGELLAAGADLVTPTIGELGVSDLARIARRP